MGPAKPSSAKKADIMACALPLRAIAVLCPLEQDAVRVLAARGAGAEQRDGHDYGYIIGFLPSASQSSTAHGVLQLRQESGRCLHKQVCQIIKGAPRCCGNSNQRPLWLVHRYG